MPAAARMEDPPRMELISLIVGIGIGTALATLIIASTAMGQYERGFDAGRKTFRL